MRHGLHGVKYIPYLSHVNQHTVIIIGTGLGGICAAINLLKLGVSDFVMLERRSFMGGTWCQNTYPGAAVDVHSPLYSLSFEPYPWTQMFAAQDELKAYTNSVIDKHSLRSKAVLNTNVEEVRWKAKDKKWTRTKGIQEIENVTTLEP